MSPVPRILALFSRVLTGIIIVSAGFDSHRDDPVGSLGLETEDFEPLSQAVLDVAATYADSRIVSVLEGGYNAGVLAGCVEVHLAQLLERQSHDKEDKAT